MFKKYSNKIPYIINQVGTKIIFFKKDLIYKMFFEEHNSIFFNVTKKN